MEKGLIQVVPDSVHFRDLKAGESDSIQVWATNCGKSPMPIRFKLSPNSPFLLFTQPTIIVPPGLEVNATIKYSPKDDQPKSAELFVECPKQKISIPVTATPPSPRIVPDTQNIRLGSIPTDFAYKFAFSMTNIGVREGSFELKWENDILSLSPSSGNIAPSKSVEISATIKIPQPGPVTINLNVNVKGSSEQVKPIVITAEAVAHTLSLSYQGKSIKSFDFDTVFFGQKRIITAQLINNGASKRSFVILGSEDTNKGKAKPKRPAEEEIVFKAYPSEGTLEPNGKMDIDFQFIPPIPSKPILEDIDLQFNQVNTIEVVETGQHLEFSMSGKGVQSYLKLSSYDFVFDKCEIEAKTVKELTIFNTSKFLPIEYKIEPIAHFRFEPSKGTIPKESSSVVKVIFFPKNYGEFNFNTNVTFNDGLVVKEINLIGVCGQLSDKPFRRVPVYETNENAKYSAEHPDRRFTDGLEGIRHSSQMRERFDGYITEYAAKRESVTRLQQLRSKLKSEGEEYLKTTQGQFTKEDLKEYVSTQMKTLKSKQAEEEEKNDDLYNGLQPPEPKILDPSNPLYFSNTSKNGYSSQNGDDPDQVLNTKRSHNDENVLIKKKFKPKPTTPAEINECSKPLTPAQQLLVSASHQTVNFGHVSVYSTSAKSFTITNNLQQHIVVSMKYEYEELSKSSPSSQVILPKQTAGFDIRFFSTKQQNFMRTIQYTINGHHNYTFNVSAQVVPIELQLSRQMIEFRFSPDSVSPYIKEFVTIINKSNSIAEYSWTGLTPVFSLSQTSGKIDPDSTQNIEVTYFPQTHSHDEATLLLNVSGGQTRSLKCVGDIGAPKCSLNKKFVNLGLIPIGILKSQALRIKNSGDDDAIFSISYDNTAELQIIPMNGRIPAHDSQTLQLNFKSVHAAAFDFPVNIQIAGSNPLTFNVTGQSELPHVQLSVNAFEFGRLFVGSSSSIEATIQNTGQIPAILFLDLSAHPDFRIEYSTELADGANNETTNSISLVSNPIFVTKNEYLPTTESTSTAIESQINESQAAISETSDDDNNGLVYKFYLLEGTSIKFNLVFQPSTAAEHSFELPFTMMNVISASSFHLQPIVSAEAIKAPITISSTALDFGIMPIYNPQNPHARSISRVISLVNESKNPIPWRIDNSALGNPAAFSFEPFNDTIAPGATTVVHVLFTAREAVPYNVHLPLLVKMAKEKEESMVSEIQLAGVGTSKLFSISQPNVVLPIVPLGVKSQMTVYVNNDGFIGSNLRVQTSASETSFPVKVSFPDGNQLLHTTVKLPVVVSFQSNKPMAFSTMIGIIDDSGNGCSFTVTCATDNSVFTLYPFFYSNKPEIKSSKGSPITIDAKTIETSSFLPCRFLNAADIIELKGQEWKSTYNPKTVKFILRYLNALSVNTQISDFPGDFIRNNGSTLLELVENISGGRRPNVDNSEKVKDDINSRQLDAMKKIVRFLQSMGCLVSHIKPEYLLDRQEFVNVMRYRITKQLLGIDYFNAPSLSSFDQTKLSEFTNSKSFSNALMQRLKIAENFYSELSNECWMFIIMQLFKVFIVGRIDQERLNQQPGFSDAVKSLTQSTSRFANMDDTLNEICRPNKNVPLSNIYSTAECTLLKWISVHSCVQYQDWQKSVNCFDALSDATCFAALLKAHTTALKVPLPNPLVDHSTPEDNAILFTSSLKSLKLAFSPTADEISSKSDCVLAIVSAYLFETLPRFIPISQVDFTTTLHKTISKAVQIQNPSKAEITYKAVLEGSAAYSLPNDCLVIPPNSSADLNVIFTARTIKKQTARLILTPLRPRYITSNTEDGETMPTTTRRESHVPIFSAPIVIDIYSDVSIVQPDMISAYEGIIYQPTKINLNVKNFIGVKSEAKLFYKISKIQDENGKQVGSNKSIATQIQEFIANPYESSKEEIVTSQSKTSNFTSLLKAHQNFVIDQTHVDFIDENSTQTVAIEFLPIDLCTYRLLLLFEDTNAGEFVIQVEAKSILPNAVEVAANKMKCEAGKKTSYSVNVDPINQALIKQLAYSYERVNNSGKFASDRKLQDMITSRCREMEAIFKSSFNQIKFNVSNSASTYFDIPSELVLSKNADPKTKPNALPITFKPTKAGEYPVKIVLTSNYDVRLFKASATAIPAVKEMSIEFNTVSGRQVHQDIPLTNPSEEVWNFKVQTTGDSCFNAPQRVSVKPGTTGQLTVNFVPLRVGQFKGELMLTNASSEATVIYKLTGVADEPPAEKKINVNCKARVPFEYELPVKAFVKNATVKVTTTVPIISFKPNIVFENGSITEPFKFNVIAQRSGVSAGTLTFTDIATGSYIWYVVEIHVDSPAPEQTITVNTSARKSATVSIKIQNPKDRTTTFTVSLSDEDLFGLKEFIVPPHGNMTYELVVSPLKAMNRTSSVYFYSDDDSEFWYALKINATEAPGQILAPMSSPLGKFATTTVTLENPLSKQANVRIENTNPTAFQVMAKRSLQLLPLEKRRIEIRYIPTSVGQKETAEISFLSQDVGDWTYSLSGNGKPPQPFSPTIVSSQIGVPMSALVLFNNSFPYPCRFNISIDSECEEGVFQFLVRKKLFTLEWFGEEYQVPFTFTPVTKGQFTAHIIVTFAGPARGDLPDNSSLLSSVRWIFPVIGNTLTAAAEAKVIKARANEFVSNNITLPLVGETEEFQASEYSVQVNLNQTNEFLRQILDIKPIEILKDGDSPDLIVNCNFSPMRPCNGTAQLRVKNPLGQEWQFDLTCTAERGKPIDTLQIESLLNKTGEVSITLPTVFRSQTPFHAYMISGSASEFTATPEHGFIEPQPGPNTETSIKIIFAPKMYGKVLRGMLVIDTLDAQFLFDVVGKTPEYVPPTVTAGSRLMQLQTTRQSVPSKNSTKRQESSMLRNSTKPRIISPNQGKHKII
ncbi:hypothetical protein TVAG_379040 [Trichomonas vaginalis G3]|uniref:Calponin-homology (CH) domain-containing protein n=1 Tax=Trichomonas vaginalis (strain ATCC PRA-98 / G3) TaxID=412133 RepID=A2DB95_TRIV3|nr:cilia- and flagella-associated protein 47 family [Trichomonas vaginalis G3]EAY22425.1 hypothetical protein TVAG_379040 [Trichomonas vaginalis G3]KAI5517628.1 cilia- and flagella-associated protein 47 family [Trichomonas vaginalis G3]|eukprot:XP_001583411.1 hypothetical protein [Trichomonas vaginalis G3]